MLVATKLAKQASEAELASKIRLKPLNHTYTVLAQVQLSNDGLYPIISIGGDDFDANTAAELRDWLVNMLAETR